MTPTDNDVRLTLYHFFIERGRPPVPTELAADLGTDQSSIEASLQRLHDGHVIVLAPGTPYIWMANPLSAVPTAFHVDTSLGEFFGSCIWDALGIIAMLHGDGRVATWCPDCGDRLVIEVVGNELATGDGIVHYAVPAAHWWDDIGFS